MGKGPDLMAGIRAVLANLAAIQDTLTITTPVNTSIKKAYKYPVSKNVALDMPAIVNIWSFPDQSTQDGSVAQGHHRYSIEMQCFINDADLSRGLEIATAFWESWLDAWVADQQLKDGGASVIVGTSLTGADPTIGLLDWNGVSYAGWTATLEGVVQRG